MNTKIKTLFLALFLVFSATVNAQDAPKKYEFATVTRYAGTKTIAVSYAGKPVETTKATNTTFVYDNHEVLSVVEKLTDEGWELVSTSDSGSDFTFVLRREKK